MSGDIKRNTPVFLAVSYLTFSNELHYLWSYQAEVHHTFLRYSHIISAVSAHWDSDIATRFRMRVQRMQVVSVGVHDIFPKSIDCHDNVPRQIGKRGTGISSALKVFSYGEKIVKIGSLYPEIFDWICQFLPSRKKYTNEPRFLWRYWTKVHEIFTRYRGVICTVNAPIQVVISHSVSERQSDKCRG